MAKKIKQIDQPKGKQLLFVKLILEDTQSLLVCDAIWTKNGERCDKTVSSLG